MDVIYILANFGGPRNLEEVYPFLKTLLLDPEVIRPKLPKFLHKLLFTRIAKKRTLRTKKDYEKIGGKSPIFEDTEKLAKELQKHLASPVIAFHRYLPATHSDFFKKIRETPCKEIKIFPLFPQFTYATTGSIAHFLAKFLPIDLLQKIRWIKSYPKHPAFIEAHRSVLAHFLKEKSLKEEETLLLFSCHGIPKSFVNEGDLYEQECQQSFQKMKECFPKSGTLLSYQSRFGREEWLTPYTEDVCYQIENYLEGRKTVVIVPLSFTSDHIETLFEIEDLYLPILQKKRISGLRCPALNFHPDWIKAVISIIQNSKGVTNQELIRL